MPPRRVVLRRRLGRAAGGRAQGGDQEGRRRARAEEARCGAGGQEDRRLEERGRGGASVDRQHDHHHQHGPSARASSGATCSPAATPGAAARARRSRADPRRASAPSAPPRRAQRVGFQPPPRWRDDGTEAQRDPGRPRRGPGRQHGWPRVRSARAAGAPLRAPARPRFHRGPRLQRLPPPGGPVLDQRARVREPTLQGAGVLPGWARVVERGGGDTARRSGEVELLRPPGRHGPRVARVTRRGARLRRDRVHPWSHRRGGARPARVRRSGDGPRHQHVRRRPRAPRRDVLLVTVRAPPRWPRSASHRCAGTGCSRSASGSRSPSSASAR